MLFGFGKKKESNSNQIIAVEYKQQLEYLKQKGLYNNLTTFSKSKWAEKEDVPITLNLLDAVTIIKTLDQDASPEAKSLLTTAKNTQTLHNNIKEIVKTSIYEMKQKGYLAIEKSDKPYNEEIIKDVTFKDAQGNGVLFEYSAAQSDNPKFIISELDFDDQMGGDATEGEDDYQATKDLKALLRKLIVAKSIKASWGTNDEIVNLSV